VSVARLRVPPRAARGEIIEIRLLLEHPMENGFRRDSLGRAMPKNIVHTLLVRYDGRDILRGELGTGIAANPYLAFFTRAMASGEVVVSWLDDAGLQGEVRASIEVT
jgi:sulfur-oxidizing protein SoxZ